MIVNRFLKYCFYLVSVFILLSCTNDKQVSEATEPISLAKIKERGKLVAVTDYNSTNYFIYRGTPMGFQYEMLKLLADYLEVDLELVVNNDLNENFEMLNRGECDIIAMNLTINKDRAQSISFTAPILQTRQVLVQRKPDDWRELTSQEISIKVIRNQLNLAGKKIYVQEKSSYVKRLQNLSDEIGDSINIVEVPMVVEDLIKLVSEKKIDYTVCDENVGKVNQTYYPNIDVQTAISFPQYIAWAVAQESSDFKNEVNGWINKFSDSYEYRLLYNKYYKNIKSVKRVKSEYYAFNSGKISPYDDIVKKYAVEIGWDWRLLASLIYQESRFNKDAVSWAGARGLMQLMPTTGERFGLNDFSSAEQNIAAGVSYIKWLDEKLKEHITDDDERVRFILASYNVGLGHILDARRLAFKYGKNPDKWEDNVDYFLLNKSKPGFYRDKVVRYGYCRGEEPYFYVNQIFERYNHYKNVLDSLDNS